QGQEAGPGVSAAAAASDGFRLRRFERGEQPSPVPCPEGTLGLGAEAFQLVEGILVALGRRLAVPLDGLPQVLADPLALLVGDPQVVLSLGVALLGCLAIPLDRLLRVLVHATPEVVAGAQLELTLGVAVFGRLAIPARCLPQVFVDAAAFAVS